MKILATGDIHLDVRGSRSGECWRFACQTAIERGVDAVVLAGDIFHGKNPSALALNEFAVGMRILEEHDVPAIAIPGNHDAALHPGRPSVLEAFHDGQHLTVVTEPEVREVGGIRIACLPWVSRQRLMALHPELTRAAAEQQLMDALERVLDMLRAAGADVLTGHWSVEGALLGGEVGLDMAITGSPTLPVHALQGPWAYAAFAHIHRQQPIPRVTLPELGGYCGSIDRGSFGEEHYTPSVTIVDLEEHEAELVPTPARIFRTITEASQDDVEGATVRLKLGPDYADHVAEIRAAMFAAGAVSVVGGAEVSREVRTRDQRVTEAISREDAEELWITAKDVSEEERPGLRETAKAIAEEAGA